MKLTNRTTLIKLGAGVLLIVLAYLSALAYWYWKWETPKLTLPGEHLSQYQMATVSSSFSSVADKAQFKMTELANELQSVSLSGAMMKDGQLVWAGAVGLASVQPQKAASIKTQYRIGSVSKSLTAVALMGMVEAQLIDLDTPIDKYLPNYPTGAKQITTRQLVSHMSGVRHYNYDFTQFPPTDGLSNIAYEDSIAALGQFKHDGLLFTPGQGFAYSTHGFTLLSVVMQAAANKPFDMVLKEFIATPLKLNQTQAEHLLTNTERLAEFYNSDNGLYGLTPEQNLSNKVAGGGIVSTPTELVTLGAALLNNSLLQPESFEKMVQVQPMFDGSKNPQSYALGWRHYKTRHILGENNQVDIIHHGGVSVGANAYFMLVPEFNITVAILTNSKGEKSRGKIQLLAYELAKMAITHGSNNQEL